VSNPSTRVLVAMLEDKLVTVPISNTRPDDAGDGVAITTWRINGKFSPTRAALFLDGSAAATITAPTGGAEGPELWGYVQGQWWFVGYLNRGADVFIVDADRGFAQEIDVIGIFERLCVAGTQSAGAVAVKLAPIEQWS